MVILRPGRGCTCSRPLSRETKRYITEAPFELPGDQEGWKREKDTGQEAVGKGSSRLTAKGGPDRTAIRGRQSSSGRLLDCIGVIVLSTAVGGIVQRLLAGCSNLVISCERVSGLVLYCDAGLLPAVGHQPGPRSLPDQ